VWGQVFDFAHTTTNIAEVSASSTAFFALTYCSVQSEFFAGTMTCRTGYRSLAVTSWAQFSWHYSPPNPIALSPYPPLKGPGCVKTCTSQGYAELFSLLSSPNSGCQHCSFSNRRNRDGISTCKLNVGIFTQPGSSTDISQCPHHVRFIPDNGYVSAAWTCPLRANNCPKCVSVLSPFIP
jgi:hypothetical protein